MLLMKDARVTSKIALMFCALIGRGNHEDEKIYQCYIIDKHAVDEILLGSTPCIIAFLIGLQSFIQ